MLCVSIGSGEVLIGTLAPANVLMGMRHHMNSDHLLLVLPVIRLLDFNSSSILNDFSLFGQLFLFFFPPLHVLVTKIWLIFLLSNHLTDVVFSHDLFFEFLLSHRILVRLEQGVRLVQDTDRFGSQQQAENAKYFDHIIIL